jgi:site-specific DNA-methyltransferase (adenine-specific)
MEADSVDAVVTDPPYGLEFMGKKWDKFTPGDVPMRRHAQMDAVNTGMSRQGGRQRACADYTKRQARDMRHFQDAMTVWAEAVYPVMKDSTYLLAFGGTRTWHRLACALEDAGFEIRDTLMWIYGTGFPKGRACLKPSYEPIILARKPGPMRELGIEECRIPSGLDYAAKCASVVGLDSNRNGHVYGKWTGKREDSYSPAGRWPANVVLDEEAAPGENWARYFYCAKASRAERNAGCEGMEESFRATLSGGKSEPHNDRDGKNRTGTVCQNHHPTVKPVNLMRWLVRLVAREGEVVLDPFMGSGTTGVACELEGRKFLGIEQNAEYIKIAQKRIAHARAESEVTP